MSYVREPPDIGRPDKIVEKLHTGKGGIYSTSADLLKGDFVILFYIYRLSTCLLVNSFKAVRELIILSVPNLSVQSTNALLALINQHNWIKKQRSNHKTQRTIRFRARASLANDAHKSC